MQNFKAFIFLGLLFGVVLITSTVTADEKAKDENEAVVDGAAKETIPVEVDDVKQGCGRCCWKGGNHYCGRGCCSPEKEETEAVENAAAYEANPDGWGGDRGGSATYEDNNEVNPDRWGGGGKGGGGKGGGGKGGGGRGGGGRGGGGRGGGGRGGGGRGGGGRGGGGKGGGGGSGGGLGGGGK